MSQLESKYGCPLMNDPVYVGYHRLACPFCNNHGQPKIFKSVWSLACHFSSVHDNDAYCQKIIADLVNLLKQGVIKS